MFDNKIKKTNQDFFMKSLKRTRSFKKGYTGFKGGKSRKFNPPGSHRGELKWLDTAFASGVTGIGGTATSISTMASGSGKNLRTGDEIISKSVRIKGYIKGVTAESIVRIILCQGNNPTVQGILPTPVLEDLFGLTNRINYKILKEITLSVGVQSVTTTANPQSGFPGLVPFDLYAKLGKGIITTYSADAAGFPNANGFFVVAICGVSATQGAPTINATARLRFLDN